MIVIILLLYGIPVYLIFFKYKLVRLTIFWKSSCGFRRSSPSCFSGLPWGATRPWPRTRTFRPR